MTRSKLSIHGIYRDVVEDAERRVVRDSGWVSNTIVSRCHELLASFMKNGPASGIQYLEVGRGSDTWDAEPVPSGPGQTALVDENPFKVEDLEVAYLDADDDVQEAPSNRLQITATLGPGYPPVDGTSYPLREFGLFGELDGEPYMINAIRHPVIHKDATTTLIRVVRLYF
jgi:hypothetical protein